MSGRQVVAAHESFCPSCGAEMAVPIALTRLERRPWRLVWRCTICLEMVQRRLPSTDARTFAEWFDCAHGSQISIREMRAVELLDQRAFEVLAREQVFDAA